MPAIPIGLMRWYDLRSPRQKKPVCDEEGDDEEDEDQEMIGLE